MISSEVVQRCLQLRLPLWRPHPCLARVDFAARQLLKQRSRALNCVVRELIYEAMQIGSGHGASSLHPAWTLVWSYDPDGTCA